MSENIIFEDLVEQFLEHSRLGDTPDIPTYAAQYPEHAEHLKELLPLLLQMEACAGEKNKRIPAGAEVLPELSGTDFSCCGKSVPAAWESSLKPVRFRSTVKSP